MHNLDVISAIINFVPVFYTVKLVFSFQWLSRAVSILITAIGHPLVHYSVCLVYGAILSPTFLLHQDCSRAETT